MLNRGHPDSGDQGRRFNLDPALAGVLSGLNKPSALGVTRSEKPFRLNTD